MGKEPHDATKDDLGRHRLQIAVEDLIVLVWIDHHYASTAIECLLGADCRPFVRAWPNRGISQHDEFRIISCGRQPGRQRHPVVGQLGEMGGRWLRGELHVHDAKPHAVVVRGQLDNLAARRHDPPNGVGGRLREQDVRPVLTETKPRHRSMGRRFLQPMGSHEGRQHRILGFENKSPRHGQVTDAVGKRYRLERFGLVGLELLDRSVVHPIGPEDVLQRGEALPLVLATLIGKETQAGAPSLLVGRIGIPSYLGTGIEVQAKASTAFASNIFRDSTLIQPKDSAHNQPPHALHERERAMVMWFRVFCKVGDKSDWAIIHQYFLETVLAGIIA
ncbi:hypothetical protein AB3480_34760 [Rhizobium mongolense]|uniref:hypothetical protein n=1 Tax=Rhizobium mongolense TaxID=57676 RepID=UPI0034A13C2B